MPLTTPFLAALEANGYDYFTGVPCSLLKGVIRRFDEEPKWGYVSAIREDSAIGLAAGAYMAGRQPAVFMQNSGLGVSMNALVSLNDIYELPCLIVVSWRGEGGKDAPEHIVMGDIMQRYFDLIGVPWRVLGEETLDEDIQALTKTMNETKKPVALIVRKGLLNAAS